MSMSNQYLLQPEDLFSQEIANNFEMLINDPSFATYDPRMDVTTSTSYPHGNQPTPNPANVMNMPHSTFYNSYPGSYARKQSTEQELYASGIHPQDLHLTDFGYNFMPTPASSSAPIPPTVAHCTPGFIFFPGRYSTGFTDAGVSEFVQALQADSQRATAQDDRLSLLLASMGCVGDQSTTTEPGSPSTPAATSDSGSGSSPSTSAGDFSPAPSTPSFEALPVHNGCGSPPPFVSTVAPPPGAPRLMAKTRATRGPGAISSSNAANALPYILPPRSSSLAGSKRIASVYEDNDSDYVDDGDDAYEDDVSSGEDSSFEYTGRPSKRKCTPTKKIFKKLATGTTSTSAGASTSASTSKDKARTAHSSSDSGSSFPTTSGSAPNTHASKKKRKNNGSGVRTASHNNNTHVCGWLIKYKGKGSQFTLKGLPVPEVGEVCPMRCKNLADLKRHRESAIWHCDPQDRWNCEDCGKVYNSRVDNRTRHMPKCRGRKHLDNDDEMSYH